MRLPQHCPSYRLSPSPVFQSALLPFLYNIIYIGCFCKFFCRIFILNRVSMPRYSMDLFMMDGEGQMAGFEYDRDRRAYRLMPCTSSVQGMSLIIQRFLDKYLTTAFHNSDIRQPNSVDHKSPSTGRYISVLTPILRSTACLRN